MVGAVEQSDAHINYRIASQNAFIHSFTHAFFYSRNVLTRNGAAENLINELEAASRRQGFHLNNNVTILAMAAGLFLVLAFNLSAATDGFTIFDNRSLQLSFHTKFTLHTLHDNFDVLVAHTADQGFLGYRVLSYDNGRILIHQASQSGHDLILVTLLLRINSSGVHRQRELDNGEFNLRVLIAQSIASSSVLQLSNNTDIACNNSLHGDLRLATHGEYVTNAFFLLTTRVVNHAVGFDGAGEYTEEAQTTYERVRGGLKY